MEQINYQPNLFPRLTAVGQFLGRLVTQLPSEEGYPSDRGAAAVLDEPVTPVYDYQAYEHATLRPAPDIAGRDL
jgi:hypothetical protein